MNVASTTLGHGPWYRVSEVPPPFVIHVRLQCEGRVFVGARGLDPRSGETVWIEIKKRERVPVFDLDFTYALWQPLAPDKWQGQLGTPITDIQSAPSWDGLEQKVWSETMRFTAVDEATAADLAREMEADRETARVQGGSTHGSRGMTRETQWWRDITRIRYEAPPQIARQDAEARVLRAVAQSEARAAPNMARDASRALATLVRDMDDKARAALDGQRVPDPVPRFDPLPRDHDDFPVAMGWFAKLNPVELRRQGTPLGTLCPEQIVIVLRSLPIPLDFVEIGYELAGMGSGIRSLVGRKGQRKPVSRQAVRERYERAIDMCHRAANGLKVHPQLEPADQIAALRERNRKYWRAG